MSRDAPGSAFRHKLRVLILHTVVTYAPFRTPFNLYSERQDKASLVPLQTFSEFPSLGRFFELTRVDWPMGYGSTAHDALPAFFRPLVKLVLKNTEIESFPCESSEVAPHLKSMVVYIYDDTIAIAECRWLCDTHLISDGQFELFDLTLTNRTNQLLAKISKECFRPCYKQLNNMPVQGSFRRPRFFKIYDDIAREDALPLEAMWVARVIQVSDSNPLPNWVNWSGGAEDAVFSFVDSEVFIGVGNSIIIGNDVDEFSRAMCLCQFYSAILSLYQGMLTRDIERMYVSSKSQRVTRIRAKLQKEIEYKLDHLDYIRLCHEQAIYGTQGHRRPLVDHINKAWQTTLHFKNVMGWSDLLHDRINRIYKAKQLRQNNLIQTLLAFIGGLALVELVLALYNNRQPSNNDSVWGVLDMMVFVPVDALLYAAFSFIFILAVLVYRNEG